jgi:hypothetical protein
MPYGSWRTQTCTVPSSLADAMNWPSGDHTTFVTPAE